MLHCRAPSCTGAGCGSPAFCPFLFHFHSFLPIGRLVTLHLTQFEGANALSAFRSQQLLTDLVAIHPKITGITARFVHLVASQSAPDSALQQRLQALLTYGESAAVPGQGDAVFVVTPRLGTISPWASKATDIARNCGLDVFRIERITEYAIALKGGLLGGKAELSAAQREHIAALLHDRMTESVLATLDDAASLFTQLTPAPLEYVDVLTGGAQAGREALERANADWGLALADDEIDYLLNAFATLQREVGDAGEALADPLNALDEALLRLDFAAARTTTANLKEILSP